MGDELMDYTERCRLCIAGSKRLSIDVFSPEGKRCKLQAKISKYLSLKVSEDDKLPSSICYQCLFRLETWVSFKKHCMDSDQTLKNWAFFCGAITPESYLNEANKSPEHGSDIEKSDTSYYCTRNENANADSRARTPPPPAPTLAPTLTPTPKPTPTESSASAPVSSAAVSQQLQGDARSPSASSSRRRGSDPADKAPKTKDISASPLNGMTRDPQTHSSKPGRRKILRPNKALPSSPPKDERKTQKDVSPNQPQPQPQLQPQPEAIKVKIEEQASDFAPGLLVKRKRGRPSKAWLKERAAALKKLREEADTPKAEESLSETQAKHKAVTELIELDDPDFGSMKFTLSVIDSATVTPSEKTVTVVYPESSASASSGRLSSDSCFKEEFSGFNIAKPETGDSASAIHERLSEAADTDTSAAFSSPEKLQRKRSPSDEAMCTCDETEEKIKKLDDIASRSVDDLKEDEGVRSARFSPSPDTGISEDARLDPRHPAAYSVAHVDASSSAYLPTTPPPPPTYLKEEIGMETETQLDDDSDSDLAAPPMSPLSPPRVEFQLIELQVETQVEERNSGREY